jgi:hypothetical protein
MTITQTIYPDDPCARVTSPAAAAENAEALLTAAARSDGDLEFWSTAVVVPLAGMLYAASPRGNNEGVAWLVRSATGKPPETLADTAQNWRNAIPYLADQRRLSDALQRGLELDPRQRDSLVLMIRDALAPWMHSESRHGSE